MWRDLIETRINELHVSGEDKVMDLSEAVRRFVRPGMKINPCALQARPSAVLYELCRQFAGKEPGFEYIASSIGNMSLSLIHLGLLKKAIVSFAGEGYPTPGPSPVMWRALDRGDVEIENWTMLTISQRLLAGAMGVPFLPTRSLAGSTIGAELAEVGNYVEIADPSNPDETFGMLRAYRPDISFVHAWAADRSGNAISFPPYGENIYGALGAREGVIVTVDHIVPTEFIRKHANLVRIPAAVVRSVSRVPFGSHPAGNFSRNVPEFKPYGNDYAFIRDCRRATKQEDTFTEWINEWILDVKDHAEYVEKLGEERIQHLYFVAQSESWQREIEGFEEELSDPRPPNSIEKMIVHASRAAAERIRERGYKTVLSGIGQATLMAWLAAHRLRDEGAEITLMAETGVYGHDPRPADPFVFNFRNLPTTTVLTDIFETLGLHTGGANNACLGTIGAAQVDRYGNVNSTRMENGMFIVGSGGANDIATASQETIVVAQQRDWTFVDRVAYITCPGQKINVVVSTMGRFEKRGDELILTGYSGSDALDKESAIREIKNLCGWDLKVSDDIEELSAPTNDEIALLRIFDPERFFLGKPT
jgi:acyl CoA:acetate/3-ketoacid CoA transferase alpha subunit/acyl CoA:acetate/3-ketoacid CoA transferase beta subunit